MTKIIIINQSVGYLTIDIVNEFAQNYKKVVLIYGNKNGLDGILHDNVIKEKIITYNKKTIFKRIFSWIFGTIQIFFKLLKYNKYEILYVTNPPISYFFARFLRQPYSVLVYDIYPDALNNIGVSNESVIYKLWAKWNKKCYKKSKFIFTLSEGMRDVLKKYVSEEKIKIIPAWSNSKNIKVVSKEENFFIKTHKLEGMFIVLYSGNIGYTHNVEVIIEIAQKMKDYSDILFLIIGEGGKKKKIQDAVGLLNLSNCRFFDYQTEDVYPHSISSGDIGVVTINEKTAKLSVPSKTFNLMCAGIPILGITPNDSDLNRLTEKYKNGACFEKKQIDEMVDFILNVKNDVILKSDLQKASLQAMKDFTSKNASLFYKYLKS